MASHGDKISKKWCKDGDCPPGAFYALIGKPGCKGVLVRSGLQFIITHEGYPAVNYYVAIHGLPYEGTTAGFYTDVGCDRTLVQDVYLKKVGKELVACAQFIVDLDTAFRLFTNRIYLIVSHDCKEYRGDVVSGCIPDPCIKCPPKPPCPPPKDCAPGDFYSVIKGKHGGPNAPHGTAKLHFSIVPNLPPTPLLSYKVKVEGFPSCHPVTAGFYTDIGCESVLVQCIKLEPKHCKLVGCGEFSLDLDTAFRLFTCRLYIKVSLDKCCQYSIKGVVKRGCLKKACCDDCASGGGKPCAGEKPKRKHCYYPPPCYYPPQPCYPHQGGHQ